MATFRRSECVVFRKTNEEFGGLSNMAGGFPVRVNGNLIPSSEALYQACRFPHLPEVQRLIISQASPMAAKMKGKPHRKDSRPDWESVKVDLMYWCLRVKLAFHFREFGGLLQRSGTKVIVEDSHKDRFWGAVPVKGRPEELVGENVLGALLMKLRAELGGGNRDDFRSVPPLAIPGFLLLGSPIEEVGPRRALAA